jgi:hypothetical protein
MKGPLTGSAFVSVTVPLKQLLHKVLLVPVFRHKAIMSVPIGNIALSNI